MSLVRLDAGKNAEITGNTNFFGDWPSFNNLTINETGTFMIKASSSFNIPYTVSSDFTVSTITLDPPLKFVGTVIVQHSTTV